MTKTRMLRLLGVAAAIWLLGSGCGRDEVPEPSIPAVDPVALEESPDQTPEDEGAAKAAQPTAAETCLQLATQENWEEALDPCTRAALEHPDDPEIRQALEHALGTDEAEIDPRDGE
jgi:hypothetical protein